jgi:hypothetical protein
LRSVWQQQPVLSAAAVRQAVQVRPQAIRHDGWQLCSDSNGQERHGCRINDGFSVVAVEEMRTFGQDSGG